MMRSIYFRFFLLSVLSIPGVSVFAQTISFSYSGYVQTYVVPKDVTGIAVDMQGATGGTNRVSRGGYGARVQCVLAVTAGTILNIYVGGAGRNANSSGEGGYNGGSPNMDRTAGGGGATDVRVGGVALSDRVIVAGGGGGATGYYFKADADRGGAGGGEIGETGYSDGINTNSLGGYGGTEKSGGKGADGEYYAGSSGEPGIGGVGAGYYSGGGGGGGYTGGGGGSMGGGGGGSSYANPLWTSSVIHTRGFNANGNGIITIAPVMPTLGKTDVADDTEEYATTDTVFRPHGTISGSVFSDFAYKAHADTILEGRSGISQYAKVPAGMSMFQFRRIALGYNYQMSPKFSAEVLLAAEDDYSTALYQSSGDLLANGKLAPFIKLANLRWKNIFSGSDLVVGQLYTPAFHNTSEEVWAYRSVARTLTDIYRTNEYDMGASLQGHLPNNDRLGYNLLVGNGTNSKPEINAFKWFYGDVSYKLFNNRVIADFYADYQKLNWTSSWHHDRQMNKIFVAYTAPKFTVGLEVFTNRLMGDNIATRTDGITKDTLTTHRTAFSVFVHGKINKDKLAFFARFDKYSWNADNNNKLFESYEAQTSIYDHNTTQEFATFGLDYSPAKHVHIMPNVWYNYYVNISPSSYGNGNRDYDLVYRLTIAYQFSSSRKVTLF